MGAGATDFGWGMATEAAGGIMGLALGAINDNRQYNQQTKLQGLQIRGQKEMADYQYKKQMQMWDETNYNAQMKQLEKAGLNPGLIYGMGGGAGGSTAAGTGGAVTGAHAPTGGGEAVAMAQQSMSMALMRAQKENIEADTANKKASAGDLTQSATGKGLDNQLKSATLDANINRAITTAEQELEKLGILITQNKLDKDTALDKQLLIANQALKTGFESTGADIHNEMQREQINAIKQEIQNGIEKVQQGWKGLDIEGKVQAINQWRSEMDKVFHGNTWYERFANKILDRIGGGASTTTDSKGRTSTTRSGGL